MILSEEDVELFFKLNWALLFYTNKKYPIIQGLNYPDLKEKNIEDVGKLQEKLFFHPELIDSFVRENPFNFSTDEINIILGWKNFVKDEFLIFYDKNSAIFLSSGKDLKAYEVLGLFEEIKNIIPFEPYMTKTVLLPFKGKIIYSGIFMGFNISFGSGMRRAVNEDFLKAKRKFGIISSLETPIVEKNESLDELLKFYIKDEKNRYEYSDEIDKIIRENPGLEKVYNQELGKASARKIRKRFLELEVNPGWFAVFNDVIIASGKIEKELSERIKEVLPEDKIGGVFIFNYKPKNKE